LVHSKEVIGIVFLFDGDEPFVIAAVGFLHAFFSFITHQKVYVRAASRIRMDRIVIALRPGNDFLVIRWIRINADYDFRPFGVTITPGSIAFADPRRGAVNWLEMHR